MAVFKSTSTAPLGLDHIYLDDRQQHHIAIKHSDLAAAPEKILETIKSPTSVIQTHTGHESPTAYKRFQFVNRGVTTESGKSYAMVLVEREGNAGKVVTATWKKSVRGQVLWESESNITTSYDPSSDIAFVGRGTQGVNYAEDDPDSATIWLQRDEEDDHPVGVTVLDFRATWAEDLGSLSDKIAAFLGAPKSEIQSRVLALL